MTDPSRLSGSSASSAAVREARRSAARRRLRRQRALTLGGVLAAVGLAVLLLSSGGGSTHTAGGGRAQAGSRRARVVPGGPLAPASVGGLASLWGPHNLAAPQPGTAAAYAAAAKRPGPGGDLVIADRGNNRILVVSPRRRVIFRYPNAHDRAAGRRLIFNDDTFVEPGGQSLIANEEDNHAIVQVGLADHSLRVLFGHPGKLGADRTHLHTPDDAYMLADGSFTVADAYNCRILFVKAHRIVRQYGRTGHCQHHPPRYFGAVNGDTPEPDGGVLISEIPGHWVDEIGPDGRLRFAVKAPVSYPSDPQPLPGGRILLADYSNPGHVLIINHDGRVLWRYGPSRGAGRMDHPSLAMPLPNGNIAVNDDFRHRVIVIDPRQKKIVWQYGHTDHPGTGANYLNTPDGMDFVPTRPAGQPNYAAVAHP